jgi:hypothetical protein
VWSNAGMSDDAFPGPEHTLRVGNDYLIKLPVRFGTESNRFPLNNIPEHLHDGRGYTYVSSMQCFFGPTFTKDHAVGYKGIAAAAGGWHPKSKPYKEQFKKAKACLPSSFSNACWALDNGDLLPAVNAFEARELYKRSKSREGTRAQTDLAKIERVNDKRK